MGVPWLVLLTLLFGGLLVGAGVLGGVLARRARLVDDREWDDDDDHDSDDLDDDEVRRRLAREPACPRCLTIIRGKRQQFCANCGNRL